MRSFFLKSACMMALVSAVLFACKKDDGCAPSNVSYATDVVPILETQCYTCHSTANGPSVSGIVLEGHANTKVKADDGSLVGAIEHQGGYSPMPGTGAKLDDCDIATIRTWVDEGSKNN